MLLLFQELENLLRENIKNSIYDKSFLVKLSLGIANIFSQSKGHVYYHLFYINIYYRGIHEKGSGDFVSIYLSIYLSTIYLSIYISFNYLSIYLSA